ncbi:MAG: methionyl-tRNA formyltransferase [Armatimonadetes bacterium]|nr:methionyl-tRNA formyltransferase [Armatimonadota bacterium]
MKLVFFGTSSFAVPALDRLKDSVVLVVAQPDRPSGRGMKVRPTAVKEAAQRHGLYVETPLKSRAPEFVQTLKALDPDAFIVASYGQILSKSLLDVPRAGAFNLHASVLPSYRGASPIQYAVLNGDEETGVTLMAMDQFRYAEDQAGQPRRLYRGGAGHRGQCQARAGRRLRTRRDVPGRGAAGGADASLWLRVCKRGTSQARGLFEAYTALTERKPI